MENLVSRLLHVSTYRNGLNFESVKSLAMVSTLWKGRLWKLRRTWWQIWLSLALVFKRNGNTWKTCCSSHEFPRMATNVSKLKKSKQQFSENEYQKYLLLKSDSYVQPSSALGVSPCICQSMGCQGPWIIGSVFSSHISGNGSLFTFVSSPILFLEQMDPRLFPKELEVSFST